jgi:hypothetical protein
MPRPVYFGALVAVAVGLVVPVCAQKPTAATARVQHVVVRGSGDAIEVEIQTSGGAVAPNTQMIAGPDRIVVDFPGALPADDLRALKVNRGPLKGVRSGLFFNNPPITRVVLDLTAPHSYQISTVNNAIVVKLGAASVPSPQPHVAASETGTPRPAVASSPRLQNAVLASGSAASLHVAPKMEAVSDPSPNTVPAASEPPAPPKPPVTVTFENGMLCIRAERATLAQVLFEVHRQTQAEIAIPAGAEQEEVFADLGPAPSRDVLASLLNGSSYNFIFVGTESRLEQVLLSRRDTNPF